MNPVKIYNGIIQRFDLRIRFVGCIHICSQEDFVFSRCECCDWRVWYKCHRVDYEISTKQEIVLINTIRRMITNI